MQIKALHTFRIILLTLLLTPALCAGGQCRLLEGLNGLHPEWLVLFALIDSGSGVDIYVSAGAGSDILGNGSQSSPYATIQKGLDQALSGQQVGVAAGTYDVPNKVSVPAGVSLYGGFNSLSWVRDLQNELSIIKNTAGVDEPTVSVTGGTPNSIVDGFTIHARSGATGVALQTSGSRTIIRNNIFQGGTATTSYGISCPGGCDIYNNIIISGSGSSSFGIYGQIGDIYIYNNTIAGGAGTTTAGIQLENSIGTVEIINNIIYLPGAASGARYCIEEKYNAGNPGDPSPTLVLNNNFDQCADAIYFDRAAGAHLGIKGGGNFAINADGSGAALTSPAGSFGNVKNAPNFTNAAGGDYRLSASTSCDVREGGQNLSLKFLNDSVGALRSALLLCAPTNTGATGWSMGAFEY